MYWRNKRAKLKPCNVPREELTGPVYRVIAMCRVALSDAHNIEVIWLKCKGASVPSVCAFHGSSVKCLWTYSKRNHSIAVTPYTVLDRWQSPHSMAWKIGSRFNSLIFLVLLNILVIYVYIHIIYTLMI